MASTTLTRTYNLSMSSTISSTSYTASTSGYYYYFSNRVMEDTDTAKVSLTSIPTTAIIDSITVTVTSSSYVNSTGMGYYSGSTQKNTGKITKANLQNLLDAGYRTIWINAYMYHLGSNCLTYTESQGARVYQKSTASCKVVISITYHTGLDIANAVVGWSKVNASGNYVWQPCAMYYWDGSAWQDVEMYRYSGSAWEKRDMRTE